MVDSFNRNRLFNWAWPISCGYPRVICSITGSICVSFLVWNVPCANKIWLSFESSSLYKFQGWKAHTSKSDRTLHFYNKFPWNFWLLDLDWYCQQKYPNSVVSVKLFWHCYLKLPAVKLVIDVLTITSRNTVKYWIHCLVLQERISKWPISLTEP